MAADEDGWSALFYAAGDGHMAALEAVLGFDNGGNVFLDFAELLDFSNDNDGCTALWVAAYNGQRQAVMLLLNRGADLAKVGKDDSSRVPPCTAAMAARRNNHPGLADLIDSERRLREADPGRRGRLLAREMSDEEFRTTLKAEEVEGGKAVSERSAGE